METAFAFEQIKRSLRGLEPLRQNEMRIECDLTQALPYRDLLDGYLALNGVEKWRWIDKEGQEINRQSLWRSAAYVLRDLLAWPGLYAYHMLRCWRLANQTPLKLRTDQGRRTLLYLRTDHWFFLESGGSVGHTRGVVESLRQLGWKTIVASTDVLEGIPQDGDFSLVRPNYGLGRNLPEMPQYSYNRQLLQAVAAHWEAWRPAWIYQRYSLGNYSGAALKKRYGVPLVLEYNGSQRWMMEHWGAKSLFHKSLADEVEMANLKASDAVVVVSRASRDELLQRGIEDQKILVNPNGVDADRYAPEIDGIEMRKKYGLEGRIVVGFIGTFGAWHGAEVLARAIVLFARDYPQYENRLRFLLVGDGQSLAAVREILAEGNASAWTVFTGRIAQEQGPRHLAACDILVAPQIPNPDGSPFFGSPTKVFEYMAMGKGIVASDLDQIGEVLTHGQTAWLVKPGEAPELMRGIKALVDDEDLRRRLGHTARARVLQKHTWSMHTKRILEFLEMRN